MIYFVRHGESEANVRHVFAGQRDNSPLSDAGEQQAKNTASAIQHGGITFARIVASPLVRTRQTAEIIAAALDFPKEQISYELRLAEYDMGDLTGTPLHAITSRELTSAPNAENPAAFRQRIEDALADLRKLPGDTLVVSHAGVGRMIEAAKRDLDPAEFYSIDAYANGQLVTIE